MLETSYFLLGVDFGWKRNKFSHMHTYLFKVQRTAVLQISFLSVPHVSNVSKTFDAQPGSIMKYF